MAERWPPSLIRNADMVAVTSRGKQLLFNRDEQNGRIVIFFPFLKILPFSFMCLKFQRFAHFFSKIQFVEMFLSVGKERVISKKEYRST